MKELKRFTRCLTAACGIIWAGLVLTGCQSEPSFADIGDLTAGQTGAGASATNRHATNTPVPYSPNTNGSDILFIGDVVTITFNSGDLNVLPAHQETIKDDGRITPPYVGSVIAKGKSPGELQAELQQLYDKLYRNMTVTMSSKDRYYYVSGDVKAPGRFPYLGETDILKAISSAGDFTDFARKTRVQINRVNGKRETIDALKAISDPKLNVPVYPGDHIFVPRRPF
jgi:polysaccharide export outer membrane protein